MSHGLYTTLRSLASSTRSEAICGCSAWQGPSLTWRFTGFFACCLGKRGPAARLRNVCAPCTRRLSIFPTQLRILRMHAALWSHIAVQNACGLMQVGLWIAPMPQGINNLCCTVPDGAWCAAHLIYRSSCGTGIGQTSKKEARLLSPPSDSSTLMQHAMCTPPACCTTLFVAWLRGSTPATRETCRHHQQLAPQRFLACRHGHCVEASCICKRHPKDAYALLGSLARL